jgi:nanoRNase/pAp phosphatase (c-di-AMP/oligoRNAs hydrolase)
MTRERIRAAFIVATMLCSVPRSVDPFPPRTFVSPRILRRSCRLHMSKKIDDGRFTSRGTYSARFLEDNGLVLATDENGRVTARPKGQIVKASPEASFIEQDEVSQRKRSTANQTTKRQSITEQPAMIVPLTGFNVILTHATADFDSLAAAVGLAKLWESGDYDDAIQSSSKKTFDSASHVPTFVVLPRGAHPGVQRFLALHKHLFPIRSLRSLPSDLSNLNRLALVDAQRKDRLGPATHLLQHAKRITVVDHHIDQDSDIKCHDYVVDKVGSVTTLISERLEAASIDLTEAEATLLALGIHADTGNLCFDSTTPRDAYALAWCMKMGASQAAIAEHAQSSLSREQQSILTQALLFANSTVVHGVTVSTVLLRADGFINGLAAVTQDALELSSSDVFLLAVLYEAQAGGRRRKRRQADETEDGKSGRKLQQALGSKLLEGNADSDFTNSMEPTIRVSWEGGESDLQQRRLRTCFDKYDQDQSGTLDSREVAAALSQSGVIASPAAIAHLMEEMVGDGDGKIDFDEFLVFSGRIDDSRARVGNAASSAITTMIVIGRARAGVNMKSVKLHKLLEKLGGGGHAKAASATVRLQNHSEASDVLQGLVDELITSSLQKQPTVGDFMTAPVLSVKPQMTEKQVEDLFLRYDVRALPVVDENNDVIGLVTYKEVAAAKQRLWNKEQKRLHREREAATNGFVGPLQVPDTKVQEQRKQGSTVKAWMKQHVQVVEASKTMAQVESILLENDVGCMPVVADGTKQLVGMVTRTDLLRQHRYYPSLHYHNKGFADSIAARKPMIELRKKLKKFDLEE